MPMLKLPRVRIPPPRRLNVSMPSSVRGRIVAAFGLLILILGLVVAGSAWLARDHRSDLADMERATTNISLLQDAKLDGSMAVALLQQYVLAGNEAFVPLVRSSWTAATNSLAEANAREH